MTLAEYPLKATECTRDTGHGGPCNGFPRRCEDNRPCWALRSLSEPLAEFFNGFDTQSFKIDPIGPTAALRRRISDLEAENTRLQTRINDLISITAMGH